MTSLSFSEYERKGWKWRGIVIWKLDLYQCDDNCSDDCVVIICCSGYNRWGRRRERKQEEEESNS